MHGPSIRPILVALALATAAPAAAASKLSVAPFGVKGAAASKQVEEALCARLECVPWAQVSVNGVKDLAKARAQGVGGLLVGGTFDRAGKRLLGINLYANSAVASRSWSFPLGADGRLKAADLATLQAGVGGLLGASTAAAPPPVAAATPAPAPAPVAKKPAAPPKLAAPTRAAAKPAAAAAQPLPSAPAPVEEEPASPPARPSAAARTAKPAAPAASPPATAWGATPTPPPAAEPAPRPMKDAMGWPKAKPEPKPQEPRTQPYLAVELGALVTDRHLSYSGGSGGALQLFDVSLRAHPAGRVELYPLAGQGPLLAGIGLFADYAHSVGFKTAVGTTKADTTFSRLHAGLLWRVPVAESFALVPALSYETLQVAVSPAVVGLPDADLSGFKAGLGLEWTLAPRWKVLAGGGYVVWTKAQDLIKGSPDPFFPGGSASALEAEAGLSVGLVGPLSLRALGVYSRTSYSLDPMAGSSPTYVATKATDTYLGFRVSLRAEF